MKNTKDVVENIMYIIVGVSCLSDPPLLLLLLFVWTGAERERERQTQKKRGGH